MQRRVFLFPLLGAMALLSGCEYEDWGSSDRFKENFSFNQPLKAGGRVYLENFNGSVEIIGWEQEKAEVTGVKYAATEDLLSQIKVEVVPEGDGIRIRTIRPMDRRGNCGAKYVVRVPKKVQLDRVESSNGSVRVEGIEGPARLKTSNGSINAWNYQGELDAATSNASIEVGQFTGSAVLRTSNGRIKADGVKGFFEASTSNSSIDATLGAMDAARPVKLHSSNGSINLVMEKYQNNEIRAETSNGSINLRMPEGANASVKASTSNGNVNSDFELKTTTFSKTRLDGTMGSGGALIDLSTTNGNVRLMRR